MNDIEKELQDLSYIWTTEKDAWVMFKLDPDDDYTYIYNQETQLIKSVSHEGLYRAVIDKMRIAGN